MDEQLSFIETQFPVSKISKESYKERKANNGQTLTGLGKWWGRKPLILVRAAILGCILPTTGDPKKDRDIFLKIMSMDESGLWERKKKNIPSAVLYKTIEKDKSLRDRFIECFDVSGDTIKIKKDVDKTSLQKAVFDRLSYDEKLNYTMRPEELDNISEESWNEINEYLGINAHSLMELIEKLSKKRYGHIIKVGDCFSGGGSIPYEAGRMGCDVFGSDLNPVAGLLTWAALHISGASDSEISQIEQFQDQTFCRVEKEINTLGVDTNELGEHAVSYLYCCETTCPECGEKVPLAPSWIIGKGTKTIAQLEKNGNHFDIHIKMKASKKEMNEALAGTVLSNGLKCPCCGRNTPISALRHDEIDRNGISHNNLRQWSENDFIPKENDVFQERLYAVKYERKDGTRYYREPNDVDLDNEKKINCFIKEHFDEWREKGYIPSTVINEGYKTTEVIRTRGWRYWHQLFNPRQLLMLGLFAQAIAEENDPLLKATGILGLNRLINFDSKLSRFNSGAGVEKVVDVFFNQALNTLYNYGTLGILSVKSCWKFNINQYRVSSNSKVLLSDARSVSETCDYWITDPPYADAVMYHELSELFLAWDKQLLMETFPGWYTDSKRILAVKGDEHFSETMIDIYSNLAQHMPDNGMQIVMFTHSDPAVWAQLAIIMWRAGLRVTAAWNIATETDASGLKNGNYVKGTVLLVLRKQKGSDIAFLDEINADIREEVKRQISSMQQLDDKEEPNFSDPDYVLAAYAASLKVLTSYKEIEDLDLDYELNKAISDPSNSKVVAIIENAKKIAYDCVIPTDFDNYFWRELTNAEKFYIKGLESEKHGNYQIGTYQEFARGFSISGYSQLMASERANSARLKTPCEIGDRSLNDVPDFQNSLMRTVFEGIYVAIKNDMNPSKGLDFIKNDIPNYWDKREMIQQILSFLVDINDISNMQEHWADSAKMADALLTVVKHDSI
jgi:putative DNA methylase